MSNKEDLAAKQAIIEAIPVEDVRTPNIPLGLFLQEAENLYKWVQQDKEELSAAGLDWSIVEDLPLRAGALREAESNWFNTRYGQGEWSEKMPQAYELRDSLLRALRYAFRENEYLLGRVQAIAQGNGHEDMIQDLNDIAVLGHDNRDLLESINFDLTLLDKAAEMSDGMAELLATVWEKRINYDGAKLLRDQAYTLLKQGVEAIRECGQYVFWNNEMRIKGYISSYFRRQRNGKRKDVPAQEVEQTDNTTETNEIAI